MNAPLYQSLLERYYDRTYGGPLFIRLVSAAFIGALTVYLHVWPPHWALAWVAAFWAGEAVTALWWQATLPRRRSADETGILALHRELIVLSSGLATLAVVPCLFTPAGSTPATAMGVALSAGALLILAAQHSLNNWMFYATAPVPAAAIIWNMAALGQGPTAWVLGALGGAYALNALALHRANTGSFADLARTQLEAESANRTKGVFLATMSHEIRTPLNGVLGMAQVMALHELTADQRERLDVIKASGETLLVLLNDLLDFSKIEAGKLELEAIPFDLGEIVRSASEPLAVIAREKGLTVKVDVAGARGARLGDPTRVRQIVQNLVSNAVKFTEAGGIEIRATSEGDQVSIVVADTGVGISEAAIARLFSEFVQADDTTTRRFGGTGLGLAICRDLARLMGGDIGVESRLGCGSRFTATLPLKAVDPAVLNDPAPAASRASLQDAAALRVLVAEDNPANVHVLKSLLAHAPADCTYVENGADAVEAWALAKFDLILMDIQMPVMDGMTATREIRRREAEAGVPRTPIYALTADAMSHQTAAHRAAGLDGHVAKPIRVEALFGVLSDVAGRTTSEHQRRSA